MKRLSLIAAATVALIGLAFLFVRSEQPVETASTSRTVSTPAAARAERRVRMGPGDATSIEDTGGQAVVVEDVTGGVVFGARARCGGEPIGAFESDEAGRLSLPETCTSLVVGADGYVPLAVDQVGERIRLTPAGSISGVVLTADGAHVADAVIDTATGAHAVSDELGRFTLPELPPARYQPRAVVLGPAPLEGRATRSIRLDLAEQREGIEIVVAPTHALTVRVEDALGSPCERAQVGLRNGLVSEMAIAEADTVSLVGLEPGEYELEARCWKSALGQNGRGSVRSNVVVNSGHRTLDVQVEAGSSVLGRVAAGGVPVEGARVVVMGVDENEPIIRSATTDESGTYSVFGLAPGSFTATLAGSGEEPTNLEVSGETIANWNLPARYPISGEVEGAQTGDVVTFTHAVGMDTFARVDEHGSFTGPELPPGKVVVVLRDRAWVELERETIQIDGSEWISFHRAPATCRLDVHVQDSSGMPIPDVMVEVAGREETRSEAAFSRGAHVGQTDVDGDVGVVGLTPGTSARLRASIRGGAVIQQDIDPCEGVVAVELASGGELTGHAPRKGESYEVSLTGPKGELYGGRFQANEWAMEGVAAGTHEVTLVTSTGWSCMGPVTVAEGGSARFDCQAKPAREVRGIVTQEGKPVRGVTVSAGQALVTTGDNGAFTLLVPEVETRLTVFDRVSLDSLERTLSPGAIDLGKLSLVDREEQAADEQ